MLIGTAVGMVAAVAATLVVGVYIRPDVVIALVIGVPCAAGIVTILLSKSRWTTALGAFLVAVGPGWFGVLVAIQAVTSG
jgi:hypothetical protein